MATEMIEDNCFKWKEKQYTVILFEKIVEKICYKNVYKLGCDSECSKFKSLFFLQACSVQRPVRYSHYCKTSSETRSLEAFDVCKIQIIDFNTLNNV